MRQVKYTAGIDIGSTCSKVAVIEGETLKDTFLLPTGYSSLETANHIRSQLEQRGFPDDQTLHYATGYGRVSVPYATKTITEITCHGKGAYYLFSKDGTIIDIGGQDTKIIQIKEGNVENFIMNDKCSAGTGRFIEIMANTLGVTIQDLNDLARNGQGIQISSMCTVFAETEVIGYIGGGASREDIAYGILQSVAMKVAQLTAKLPSRQYFLTGGLCDSPYLLESLGTILGEPVQTNPLARYAGAIGAALCGLKIK